MKVVPIKKVFRDIIVTKKLEVEQDVVGRVQILYTDNEDLFRDRGNI